jgi:hypothetical protein
MTISLPESVIHIFASSLPEFLGSLMAASVLAAASWGARKMRARSRTRRIDTLRPAREAGDEQRPAA